eukprot:s2140_g4.t1
MTEFRSCCGSLQWLAGQTRPDIASAVSLSSKGLETKIDDLKRLYSLMSYVKATSDQGIVLKPIDLDCNTVVVSYGDCSWANAAGMKSQEGIIVVLSSAECLEGKSRCIPVDWKTCRTPRVVRSTLAGEAYAADDAVDRTHLVNAMLTEILTGESILDTGPILKHAHGTDYCRSLFDSVISSNPNTEEKRVLLTIRAIQEALDPKMMRWVPTDKMIADVLTKDSDNLRWSFLPWMKDPVNDEEIEGEEEEGGDDNPPDDPPHGGGDPNGDAIVNAALNGVPLNGQAVNQPPNFDYEDDDEEMPEETPDERRIRYQNSSQDEVSDPDEWATLHYGHLDFDEYERIKSV